MEKTNEQQPIMGYVRELEEKVRSARADCWNYQKLAFMLCVKNLVFWLGVMVGVGFLSDVGGGY